MCLSSASQGSSAEELCISLMHRKHLGKESLTKKVSNRIVKVVQLLCYADVRALVEVFKDNLGCIFFFSQLLQLVVKSCSLSPQTFPYGLFQKIIISLQLLLFAGGRVFQLANNVLETDFLCSFFVFLYFGWRQLRKLHGS